MPPVSTHLSPALLALALACAGPPAAHAQVSPLSCATVPTAEDLAYLSADLAARAAPRPLAGRSVARVRVAAHLLRDDDGANGLGEAEWRARLDAANERYAVAGVAFVQCSPVEYINSSRFNAFERDADEDALRSAHDVPGAINVYFVDRVADGGDAYCGYALYPDATTRGTGTNFAVVDRECPATTLAHELGHSLGLYHTHDGATGVNPEHVDGSNCGVAGDYVCDTPADPGLATSDVDRDCDYVGTATDVNGDRYRPDPRNLMSYGRKECRDFLSAGQRDRLAYSTAHDYAAAACDLLSADHAHRQRPPTDVDLVAFPNPFADRLVVRLPAPAGGRLLSGVTVAVSDLTGREVFRARQRSPGRAVEIAPGLPPGTYVLNVCAGGYSESIRITTMK